MAIGIGSNINMNTSIETSTTNNEPPQATQLEPTETSSATFENQTFNSAGEITPSLAANYLAAQLNAQLDSQLNSESSTKTDPKGAGDTPIYLLPVDPNHTPPNGPQSF